MSKEKEILLAGYTPPERREGVEVFWTRVASSQKETPRAVCTMVHAKTGKLVYCGSAEKAPLLAGMKK